MTPLSHEAQAIWDAFNEDEAGVFVDYGDKLAAAFRAAADQVVPDVDLHVSVAAELLPKDIGAAKWSARHEARRHLLAIADELEAV